MAAFKFREKKERERRGIHVWKKTSAY